MIEDYIAVRQRQEVDALRLFPIENIYLEYTKDSKWSFDDDLVEFSMIWRYSSGNFDKFAKGVEEWKTHLYGVIVPIGKRINGFERIFYEVNTLEDADKVYARGEGQIYCDIAFWRRNSTALITRASNRGVDLKVIVKSGSKMRRGKYIIARIVYTPLDYAISKRVMVFKHGNREIRDIDSFGLVDYKQTFNEEIPYISFEKMKKGDYLEIFKFNAFAYWYYIINRKRGFPRWMAEYEKLKAENKLPDWVEDVDKKGRPKIRYLSSRFNRVQHGVYAKLLHEENFICDTCPIKDICPLYQKGAVCAFTQIWKKIGNTRNVDWIIKKLEEVIAEEYARYMRAVYIEGMSGDVANKSITQLGDMLVKHLEIYNRLIRGKDVDVGGKITLDVAVNLDEALNEVRRKYGEELYKKIEKKISDVDGEE